MKLEERVKALCPEDRAIYEKACINYRIYNDMARPGADTWMMQAGLYAVEIYHRPYNERLRRLGV